MLSTICLIHFLSQTSGHGRSFFTEWEVIRGVLHQSVNELLRVLQFILVKQLNWAPLNLAQTFPFIHF